MSLKIVLKAHEKVIIGEAVLRNGGRASEFFIENTVPILRQKDILRECDAQSPAKRIYFAVQLMYIDTGERDVHMQSFFKLSDEIVEAAPSTGDFVQKMRKSVAAGKYYQALKTARALIAYEEELTRNA